MANSDVNIKKIAQKELQENYEALEALRQYDAGEKEISTTKLEERVRDLGGSV